jgi:DNA-binding GntR family transcriptional regulator
MDNKDQQKSNLLAEQIYAGVKEEIFSFRLLPGDRFTETEMAERFKVSRTPVRDALYRLEREGFLQVSFRSGWSVRPFDFAQFEELYDLRITLEIAAVEKICETENPPELAGLNEIWLVSKEQRLTDAQQVAGLDEAFHEGLQIAAGNREMVRVHREITERIRIIRRLDFIKPQRVDATYDEHAEILRLLRRRNSAEAVMLLRSHIEVSKLEVRKITLHMLHEAREMGQGLKSSR